jgi:hypothetical protein
LDISPAELHKIQDKFKDTEPQEREILRKLGSKIERGILKAQEAFWIPLKKIRPFLFDDANWSEPSQADEKTAEISYARAAQELIDTRKAPAYLALEKELAAAYEALKCWGQVAERSGEVKFHETVAAEVSKRLAAVEGIPSSEQEVKSPECQRREVSFEERYRLVFNSLYESYQRLPEPERGRFAETLMLNAQFFRDWAERFKADGERKPLVQLEQAPWERAKR